MRTAPGESRGTLPATQFSQPEMHRQSKKILASERLGAKKNPNFYADKKKSFKIRFESAMNSPPITHKIRLKFAHTRGCEFQDRTAQLADIELQHTRKRHLHK